VTDTWNCADLTAGNGGIPPLGCPNASVTEFGPEPVGEAGISDATGAPLPSSQPVPAGDGAPQVVPGTRPGRTTNPAPAPTRTKTPTKAPTKAPDRANGDRAPGFAG
ncbi:MAG: hypothetical protein PHU75_02010, partial [Candidatus Nanopelagicales bacterium]|nr:hypothetical protein [Candidatus Nanopelagicales bacterium]